VWVIFPLISSTLPLFLIIDHIPVELYEFVYFMDSRVQVLAPRTEDFAAVSEKFIGCSDLNSFETNRKGFERDYLLSYGCFYPKTLTGIALIILRVALISD
jgi:hypothetical protein